jgi:hypothetical protein
MGALSENRHEVARDVPGPMLCNDWKKKNRAAILNHASVNL